MMALQLHRSFVELVKFGIVGGVCTGIDAIVFYFLHQQIGYRVAIIVGFLLSVCVNYILNIYWAFSSRPTMKNAIGILGAHTFNIFVVRLGLMWLFTELFAITEGLAYIPTLFISIITNFLIIKFIAVRYR